MFSVVVRRQQMLFLINEHLFTVLMVQQAGKSLEQREKVPYFTMKAPKTVFHSKPLEFSF